MLAYAGTAVAIGVPPVPSEVTLPWNGIGPCRLPAQGEAADHRRRRSDPRPRTSRRWPAGTSTGRLDLDGMVTREARLTDDDLDEAFRAMLAGEVIRTVVVLDPGAAG